MRPAQCLTLLAFTLGGCQAGDPLAGTGIELFRTDAPSYQLRHTWVDPSYVGYYNVHIAVTLVNSRSRPLRLHRVCGRGLTPWHVLIRLDDTGDLPRLSRSGCTLPGGDGPGTIDVGPGETYVDRIRLYFEGEPQPAFYRRRAGYFQLRYFVLEGEERLAFEGSVTNPFRLTVADFQIGNAPPFP